MVHASVKLKLSCTVWKHTYVCTICNLPIVVPSISSTANVIGNTAVLLNISVTLGVALPLSSTLYLLLLNPKERTVRKYILLKLKHYACNEIRQKH